MPRFYAYDPDNGDADDARAFDALDAGDAAEQYAEAADHRSAEYRYASEGGVVMVRAEGSETWVRYAITGEAVPVYHAREIRPTPARDGESAKRGTGAEGDQRDEKGGGDGRA